MKIVVDCAHGATYHIAPAVFKELIAEVIAMGVEPNVQRGKVGATDVRVITSHSFKWLTALGLGFDGDGDRIIMVDELGNKVDGDKLPHIIARDALRREEVN